MGTSVILSSRRVGSMIVCVHVFVSCLYVWKVYCEFTFCFFFTLFVFFFWSINDSSLNLMFVLSFFVNFTTFFLLDLTRENIISDRSVCLIVVYCTRYFIRQCH